MIYGSICSGIEAASVAWDGLDWQPAFFSEIEKFPRALLAHHYPAVPLHGDFTTIDEGEYEPIDLLVGGTPCQSFSIAGKRLGLDDPRGNLAIEYLRLARRLRPRWLVWENVPGVLSSNSGRDFGTFVAFLGECGYGWAYRILDAQYFGVPQRRRRVFVIGYLGDWRPAAAVLFEPESLLRHSAPRRETRKDIAPTISARPSGGGGPGTDFDLDGGLIPQVTGTLKSMSKSGGWSHSADHAAAGFIIPDLTHSLRGEGHDASEDGTGRGIPIVSHALNAGGGAVAYAIQAGALRENASSGPDGIGIQPDLSYTLEARPEVQVVAFNLRGREDGAQPEVSGVASMRASSGGSSRSYIAQSKVRRLMPRECERLQGFPDDYTLIPWRRKLAPDGPRYKALGNSMAVPVMRWIGERIMLMNRCNP